MTTDNHSFKSRAGIESNICSFFVVFQATKLRRKNNRKTLCSEEEATRRIGALLLLSRKLYVNMASKIFTVFTIYRATKLQREIDEKPYAGKKAQSDEFYPERGQEII